MVLWGPLRVNMCLVVRQSSYGVRMELVSSEEQPSLMGPDTGGAVPA